MPWFADFYSPFIPAAFELLGYDAENLPPSDEKTVEYGLKYSNNEICYPATLVVGDFIKALHSGKYRREEIALGITQTGGQCRATNYITLMKKAMIAAGFEDIPVIAVSTGAGSINEQPGFTIDWKKVIVPVITCLAYADCLSQMYYATAPREREKGIAGKLKQKYIDFGVEAIRKGNSNILYGLAQKAAVEFNGMNTHAGIPRIGIVGEIYVKYNNFGHKNVVNWLIEQGVEPVTPPLTAFLTDGFVNAAARVEGNLAERKRLKKAVFFAADKYVTHVNKKMREYCIAFPYIQSLGTPEDDARKASLIINTNAQFGEGWRIPAEFAHFAESGVNNVVSLQPFGCIANHIVSKGIEKRTRELYPSLNLLFLDFDSGMAETNIFNRLHFMVKNAREEMKKHACITLADVSNY
jgi:predicted nucleotide-binding protein (sugar kinase/HSP70/actin superfamily)